ncbi:MAG: hypothetical protein R2729_08120 [Bryobacteraceae bacterium]
MTAAVLTASPPGRKPEHPRSLHVAFWPEQVREVPADALRASIGGKAVKVSRLFGPDDDLLLLIVMDLTGDISLADPAREALASEIERLPDNVEAGLLRAQDGLSVLVDPGAEKPALTKAIRDLPVSGYAGLLDSVETALHLGDAILAKAAVRVAVLYVTDSSIQNYRAGYTNPVVNSSDSRDMSRRFPEGLVKEETGKILAKVARTQTPLFVVHLDYRSDRLNEAYQTGLIDIVNASGGSVQYCRTPADIPGAIAGAVARIRAHQSAEIEPPLPPGSIDLALEAEGFVLHYRSRFEARKR